MSESCQSLSAGLVTFNALQSGWRDFSASVPCYELVEISGLTRWRARSTIALVGTAGIGKSRMAHEFVSALRQKDWQVLGAFLAAGPLGGYSLYGVADG